MEDPDELEAQLAACTMALDPESGLSNTLAIPPECAPMIKRMDEEGVIQFSLPEDLKRKCFFAVRDTIKQYIKNKND